MYIWIGVMSFTCSLMEICSTEQIFVRILVLRMAESGSMHISKLSRVSGLFMHSDGKNLHVNLITPIHVLYCPGLVLMGARSSSI